MSIKHIRGQSVTVFHKKKALVSATWFGSMSAAATLREFLLFISHLVNCKQYEAQSFYQSNAPNPHT